MCIDCKKKLYTLRNFNFMSKKNFALFMNVMSMANATPPASHQSLNNYLYGNIQRFGYEDKSKQISG